MNRRSWLILALVLAVGIAGALLLAYRPTPGASAPSAPAPPVSIGAILPLTGDYAPYGKRSLKAFHLGLQDGGLREGSGYRLVVEDDGAEPKRAVAAAEKLLSTDNAEFLLGPFPSGGVIAVGPIVRARPVILMTPSATAPSISGMASNVFRTCPSDTAEAEVVARSLLEQRLMSVSILYIKNEYGEQLRQAFTTSYTGGGGKVAFVDAFPPATRNFRTLVGRALASGSEATYLIGYDELQGLVRTLVELGGKATHPVFTNVMINNPAILAGMKSCDPCKAWRIRYPVWGVPEQATKVAALEGRLGERSDPFAVNSYNIGRVIARVIVQADAKTTEQRIAFLRATTFEGLAGSFRFDEKGDVHLPVNLQEVFP